MTKPLPLLRIRLLCGIVVAQHHAECRRTTLALHRRRAFEVAAAILAAVAMNAAPASAGNFLGCDTNFEPCFANNSYHTMTYNLGPRMRTAMERTRTESYETTRLTTAVASTATHDPNEDVYYAFDPNLTPGVVGQYNCVYGGAGGTCNHGDVYYQSDEIDGFSDSDLQALACHETGHTVGLRHPAEFGLPNDGNFYQCMIQGGYPGKPRFLGGHNADHINGRY